MGGFGAGRSWVACWVGCAAGVGRFEVLALERLVVGRRADDPGVLGLVGIVSEREI
jgi:hypothetical protein